MHEKMISANLKGVAKTSLHFWNLADLGVEIDYSELEHWYG